MVAAIKLMHLRIQRLHLAVLLWQRLQGGSPRGKSRSRAYGPAECQAIDVAVTVSVSRGFFSSLTIRSHQLVSAHSKLSEPFTGKRGTRNRDLKFVSTIKLI